MSYHILLVEDSPRKSALIQEAIRAVLPGVTLHIAETSVDARHALHTVLDFQAVITDHLIPMRDHQRPSAVAGDMVVAEALRVLGDARKVCVCSSETPPEGWRDNFPGVLWIVVDYVRQGLEEWVKGWPERERFQVLAEESAARVKALAKVATAATRAEAELREFIALVAREVAAQQLYERRVYFDDLRPVKSVGLRSILPGEVSRVAEDFWRDRRDMAQSYLRAATRGDTDALKLLGDSMLMTIHSNRKEG